MQITKRRNVIRVAGILLLGHAVGLGETASQEGASAGKPPDPTHEVFLEVVRAGQSTGVTIARGLPTAFGMKLKPRADQEIWIVKSEDTPEPKEIDEADALAVSDLVDRFIRQIQRDKRVEVPAATPGQTEYVKLTIQKFHQMSINCAVTPPSADDWRKLRVITGMLKKRIRPEAKDRFVQIVGE